MISSLLVSLKNEQVRLKDQLALHAQETATSLAFSISNARENGQQALIDSMVNVIFDSGYYKQITFTGIHGEIILKRDRPVKIEGVPSWFLSWNLILPASGSATVVSGWKQLGELEVVINPGLASREYWLLLREQGILFITMTILACLLAAEALSMLLKPLHEIEKQAEAICQKKFIEQKKLPRTRELRQVVLAMNKMSRKLKEIFAEQLKLIENLHVQSYIDQVTNLSNRNHFNALLQTVIDRKEKCDGVMLLIQASNFIEFNLVHGREKGDQCLRILSDKLKELFSECPEAIIGRRGGIDFAVYLPGFPLERAKQLATLYLKWAEGLDILKADNIYLPLHIGISFTENIKFGHTLFNEADLALGQAQSNPNNSWKLYHNENSTEAVLQAREWFQFLNKTIENRNIVFDYQPLFNRHKTIIASEALCRIKEGENTINAGVFFPMVDRFNLNVSFDEMILEKISGIVIPDGEYFLTVNISNKTLMKNEFTVWIERFLQKNPILARNIVFEMAEHSAMFNNDSLINFCATVNKYGASFSMDHFGVNSIVFSRIQNLALRYLKIDRTFIKDINENITNQFYVKSLVQIAHSHDVLVYAEGVETEAEWICILDLGLDGAQGYYLCRPSEKLILQ